MDPSKGLGTEEAWGVGLELQLGENGQLEPPEGKVA